MIKLLDKNIANKIAAGEVIDRPVSIVKELVENSLDAGATAVTIEIREGGRNYIRVTDNGCGIPADEAELAFMRHATSKISDERDLDAITTLGFRGEALASICAVARVELITKTADTKAGRLVVNEGSRILENSRIGCPDGTTITVKDLFYNVPARKKFLNSAASEARRIIDFASRIALSYPDVRFSVINGSKPVFTTSGNGNITANILSIYGADLGKSLIPVEKAEKGFTLKGCISDPGTSMPSRNRQVFCVNGRIISSSVMERALDKAYRERLFNGRFPVAFLFLAMPPEKLDVNIHPTKKEIRFDDNAEVEDFVQMAVMEALRGEEAIPSAANTHEIKIPEVNESTYSYVSGVKDETVRRIAVRGGEKEEQVNITSILTTLRDDLNRASDTSPRQEDQPAGSPLSINRPFEFDDLRVIGSVFNTYIACQSEDSFYLIDQHAAHERVFYEKLVRQYHSDEKVQQQLMLPLTFNVPADVSSTESSWISAVRAMGYDIEFFGNNTYIVREIPAFMELSEAEDFLNDMFNEFTERPDLSNTGILEKIIMKACKSAIKAGDAISREEILALFDQLQQCDNPFSCPHGRPVFVRITKYEMERMFKRA
ncbi:MAG: DNA mismatch repair endonuclease MutL [Bacillota bacterium]|nr:DNA mismatch repair endonuclease MutL [Bacillota bacterium]